MRTTKKIKMKRETMDSNRTSDSTQKQKGGKARRCPEQPMFRLIDWRWKWQTVEFRLPSRMQTFHQSSIICWLALCSFILYYLRWFRLRAIRHSFVSWPNVPSSFPLLEFALVTCISVSSIHRSFNSYNIGSFILIKPTTTNCVSFSKSSLRAVR